MQKKSNLKKLAGRLLATTCLTAATSAVALGGSVTLPEGAQGAYPGDLLPLGTTMVSGIVSLNNGSAGDFFEFQGLTGGESFSALGLEIESISLQGINYELYADTPSPETVLQSSTAVAGTTNSFPTGTVPTDGNLIVEIMPTNEAASNYIVTINSPVPEPETLSTLGLGLIGLGGLGRRRLRSK